MGMGTEHGFMGSYKRLAVLKTKDNSIVFLPLSHAPVPLSLIFTGKIISLAGKFINSPETSSSPARSADSGESQNAPN
jgi:hypothetical protein